MQTTTTYTRTVTITTDDDGTRHVSRATHADTMSAYLFDELSPEAQERAISDAIAEEEDPDNWYVSHTYFAHDEIWQCVRDLEKQQPIDIYDSYGIWGKTTDCGGYGVYELVTEAKDSGMCYSVSMCETWNRYAPRIMVLAQGAEDALDKAAEHDTLAYEAERSRDDAETAAERKAFDAYRRIEENLTQHFSELAERCADAAEELAAEAAQAVADTVEGLLEAKADYYLSAEFWREWLSDGETRFTRDGERI